MKPSLTSQEQALRSQGRHRMIGAAIIMLMVVLLLPMILNHATTPKLPEATEPAPDSLPTAVVLPSPNPIPVITEAEPTAKPLTVDVGAQMVAPNTTVAAPTASASTLPTPTPPTPTTTPADSATPAAGGMMLQVGVFSNPDRAASLAKRLNKQGIHTVSDVVHHESGDRTHVRVGPVANRAEAVDMKARLEKIGIAALIQTH